jgi:hypothetical protein
MQETIANFAIAFHRYQTEGAGCEFIFTTTAATTNQRIDDNVPVNVLETWAALSSTKDLSSRDDLVAAIKALEADFRAGTKDVERVAKVSAAFNYLDAGNWDAFLLSVTWVFEAADYVRVRSDAEATISADTRFAHLPAPLAFERLLVEVLQRSSNKKLDDRELTRDRLVQIAALTQAELEQWLATNSGVLARLSRFETELAEIRQLVMLARRPPSSRALHSPTAFATSARLTEGVAALQTHIAGGARVIGLRGAPGDGKTQVARQLAVRASASYWELPNAANTTGAVDANEVWRVGLAELASALSGETCADRPIEALARLIRERVESLPRPHLLILDNADSDPPIDLRDLLSNDAACVAVGGGATQCDRTVSLRKPHPDEFVEMVNEAADPNRVQAGELSVVKEIGALVDFSPLLAGFVSERLGSELELRDLCGELSAAGADPRVRMHAVFLKAWNNLSVPAKSLARVLGSWAQPEVPIVWIPEQFREADAVQILVRSHLASRTTVAGSPALRLHRLVIQWMRTEDVGSFEPVAKALTAWVSDPELSDELKSGGRRKLALVRAFELLHKRDALGGLDPTELALLQSAYIDQSTVFGSDPATVERQVAVLAATEDQLDSLHPAVLGQMVDALRVAVIEGSAQLQSLRKRALVLLEKHVNTLAGSTAVTLLDEIAEHHYGKHLLHADDGARRDEGLKVLQRADEQATRELERASGASKAQWLARRSKTRIQICDQQASPLGSNEAIEIMRGEFANTDLPPYIRLVAARQLLRRAAGLEKAETISTLKAGLDLAGKTQHDDVATLFLSEASKVFAIVENEPVANLIEDALEAWLHRLLESASPSRRGSMAAAFGNAKFAEGQTDGKAMSRLIRALLLMERVLDGGDPYHRQRVLAVLRDSGALNAAAAIADCDKDIDWYWTDYEVVETWRWNGEFEMASEMLARMAADPRNAKQLKWINGEKAKLLAKRGDLDGARAVLEANALAWRASKESIYAEQCESWLAAMTAGRVRAADGILEDEWRAAQRRSAVADVELAALDEAAERIAAGVLASKRRKR